MTLTVLASVGTMPKTISLVALESRVGVFHQVAQPNIYQPHRSSKAESCRTGSWSTWAAVQSTGGKQMNFENSCSQLRQGLKRVQSSKYSTIQWPIVAIRRRADESQQHLRLNNSTSVASSQPNLENAVGFSPISPHKSPTSLGGREACCGR